MIKIRAIRRGKADQHCTNNDSQKKSEKLKIKKELMQKLFLERQMKLQKN